MSTEIDCDNTDEIVCPYCGHEHGDSWEYFSREEHNTTMECADCGKHFMASKQVSVEYSASKLPCMNGEGEHDWTKWEPLFAGLERRYCRDCQSEERRKKDGDK